MQYSLSKHHGLGNDFLVFDVAQGNPNEQWSVLARRWCHRSTGIGADGLLLLGGAGGTDLTMRLFNADGSEAEMSGNGIRCLVQAAHARSGLPVGSTYSVTTAAGLRVACVMSDEGDDTLYVSVDMGTVETITEPSNWAALDCHPDRPVSHVSLGNPHSVVGVDDVASVDLKALGEKVPQINLEIIEPGPESHGITMRVHERGAGITAACGTGACAAADAALSWGLVPRSSSEVVVHMEGGDARVRIAPDRRATLVGPAVMIATVSVMA